MTADSKPPYANMSNSNTCSQLERDGSEGMGAGTAFPLAIQVRPRSPKIRSGAIFTSANPLLTRAPAITLRMLTAARKPMNIVVVAIPPSRLPAQGQKPAR
jgi:hypothetical protein